MKNKAEKFKMKAEQLGYHVRSYSGRCMYGRECPAVIVNNPNDFIAEIRMTGLKVDNMGLSYIVYTG